jgi:uncharacterized protein (DUF1501 family)
MVQLDRRMVLTGSLALAGSGLATPRIAFSKDLGRRNFLFVLLRGAADGLAMVAPLGDPHFAALRAPMLADYDGALRLEDFFAIHPSLSTISKAVTAGEALFVHATATSYRQRSHFDGQNLLETGGLRPYALRDGWLNRLTALLNEQPQLASSQALAISTSLPLALRGDAPVSNYAPSALPQAGEDLLSRVTQLFAADSELGSLWSRALETRSMAANDGLKDLRDSHATGELAASLMRDSNGATIGMIELAGWDSHANLRGNFSRRAAELDALITGYRTAMGEAWKDTLVVVATEFGRTARLNGTGGTDHGTACAALILGGTVRGGRVIADWPGLAAHQLYEGRDLAPTIALEDVLAGALAEHFKLDPSRMIASLFPGRAAEPMLGLVRA